MKKRKLVKLIGYIMLLAVVCLSGCNKKDKSSNKVDISKNEFIKILPSELKDDEEPIICINKLDLEIKKDNTVWCGFAIHVLTKEPLKEENVQVNIETERTYTLIAEEPVKVEGKINVELCAKYNNLDSNLYQGHTEDSIKYLDEYNQLTDDMFPVFYDNKFMIQANDYENNFSEDESFNEIDIIINGIKYTVDIGKVTLNNADESYLKGEKGDYDLSLGSAGRIGVPLNIIDGIFEIPSYNMHVKKDLIIKNVKLYNQSNTLSIEKVIFDYESEGMMINKLWKPGDDIYITAGSRPSVKLVFKDSNAITNSNYALNIFFGLEYEVEGNTYEATTNLTAEAKYDGHELYAIYKDKLDISGDKN